MATTTPNYGWDVPTSTDYVKDGATAIETLGDDIDASLYSITNGKNVGLVPLITTAFTTQTAVQIDNVFSSTYDNYRIVFAQSACTASNSIINFKFVDGTTPTSSSLFYYGATGLGAGASAVSNNGSATSSVIVNRIETSAGDIASFSMDVINPNKANRTVFLWSAYNYNGAVTFSFVGGGEWDATTQFEGFYLAPGSGTFTGTVSVYGYRK